MVEGRKVLQIIFVIFNAIMMLGSILIIAAGGYALSGALSEIVPIGNFDAIAGIIVTVGVFGLLVAVLGLVGGIRRHTIVLKIYFALLTLICIIQLGEAIGAFALRPMLDEVVTDGWSYAYRNNATGVLQSVQNLLDCCGFMTITDMPAIPCPSYATMGCFLKIHDTLGSQLIYIGVACIVTLLFEVGALIVSCMLHGDRGRSAYEDERAHI